jgi:dTDP-4-dehydrorhamnose reductase
MRVVVTGTQGQVARALQERAERFPDLRVVLVGRPQLELESTATVLPAIAATRPDLIINAAAYTAVDRAEVETIRAFAINRDGAAAVANAARSLGVPLIHLSTDYVFSGFKDGAYVEGDKTGPLSIYGRSKLEGELAVRGALESSLVLRTSWIYGPYGTNFVKTILRLAAERRQIRVVDDQIGNPTSALDLAQAILEISPRFLESKAAGTILHISGSGSVSWYGLAKYVLAVSQLNGGPTAEVAPISTLEYPTAAARPFNSRLDTSAFGKRFNCRLPDWQLGVEKTVRRLVKSESD